MSVPSMSKKITGEVTLQLLNQVLARNRRGGQFSPDALANLRQN
jgi:hypothetical protein